MKIIFPESVVGKWKSVKMTVRDQEKGTKEIYQVDIGGSFQIPETSIGVMVKSFMPAFSANSERATSMSNQPTNPAILIVVQDGEKELHRGWVFGLYPDRHQFEDPRYKFVLLDYQPER
ncbi:hypothetical protein [Malonomonas rubra]|uniref:hypothetical protein n=1 Tax=Malonomonas rubra TaxID=57040 RepID=UPI0026F1C848|nr:hypothetical protein [Malonomonas rubra]